MSEDEQYFLFVHFENHQLTQNKQQKEKRIIPIQHTIHKATRQHLTVLGEFCKRVPVDFNPLQTHTVYVLCIHTLTASVPYTFSGFCNHFVVSETMDKASELKQQIENGDFKKHLESGEEFEKVEVIAVRLYTN